MRRRPAIALTRSVAEYARAPPRRTAAPPATASALPRRPGRIGFRGATRLCRAAPNVEGGWGATSGPPIYLVSPWPANERRRPNRVEAEAAGDAVHRSRETLAAHGAVLEQPELPGLLRGQRRGGDADQPHRLHEPPARQQDGHAPVELQTVMRRVAPVAARERAKV